MAAWNRRTRVPEGAETTARARIGRPRWRWAAAAVAVPLAAAAGFAGAVRTDLVPRPPQWPEALGPPYTDERGCPTGEGDAIIDWVPFLRFGGRRYSAQSPDGAPFETVGASRISEVLGEITCSVPSTGAGGLERPSYPDGTAPFVPVGTPVHRLRGLPVECAVVMELHGKMTVYYAMAPNADRPTRACPDTRLTE
ncbi:hypothetical protein GCM10022221_11370 [Actinocorallia aurea]